MPKSSNNGITTRRGDKESAVDLEHIYNLKYIARFAACRLPTISKAVLVELTDGVDFQNDQDILLLLKFDAVREGTSGDFFFNYRAENRRSKLKDTYNNVNKLVRYQISIIAKFRHSYFHLFLVQ